MKFGGDTDTYTDRKDTFVGWSSGQYEFDSLTDFQAGNAQALIQNLGLNGKPLFASGTLYNNYNSTLGLYWQDKWQITPRITLTYGLRWEGSWYPQPQTAFPGTATYAGTGSSTHEIGVPQRVPDDFKQLGPRIGLAWNVGSNESPNRRPRCLGLLLRSDPAAFHAHGRRRQDRGTVLFLQLGLSTFASISVPVPQQHDSGCQSALRHPDPSNGVIYGCPGPNLVDPNFRDPQISNLTAGVEHTFARSWT